MFRFTIRDVLWLTVVVGVGLSLGIGWWRDRLALKATRKDLLITQVARDAFEADAKDLGNMLDVFGRNMPQQRVDELRQRYVEKKLPKIPDLWPFDGK